MHSDCADSIPVRPKKTVASLATFVLSVTGTAGHQSAMSLELIGLNTELSFASARLMAASIFPECVSAMNGTIQTPRYAVKRIHVCVVNRHMLGCPA